MEINIIEYAIKNWTLILSLAIYAFIMQQIYILFFQNVRNKTFFRNKVQYSVGDVVIYRQDALRSINGEKEITLSSVWIIIDYRENTGVFVLVNCHFKGAFRLSTKKDITIFKKLEDLSCN